MNFQYKRLIIVGCGGAGKSTLARYIGEAFDLPVVHLDKLWWLPGWVSRDEKEFDAMLQTELEKPLWVMDGNYRRTLSHRLEFADCAIFLDISTEECLKSVYDRAERYRGKTRPDMTDGCEETVDPEFEIWIKEYENNVRGDILRLLKESGVPYFVFQSRKDAYDWVDTFKFS